MEDDLLSRATVIRDPAVAAVFANSRLRRVLMLFANRPLSLSGAAARANIDLKRLHYHVQKLVRLKLLEVASVKPRAGRSIKFYRAVSDLFFVPDEALPKPFGDELASELRERLQAAASRSSAGLLLTVGPQGEPLGKVVVRGGSAKAAFELWRILRLAPDDVEALRSDINAVFQRYQDRTSSRGSVFLIHAAAARRADESGVIDNPSAGT